MSNFTFNLPNGETFELKMPSGATFEQAKAVFDQQVASGGLTGFNVGDTLSAATQAADGLLSAGSQFSQLLASAQGSLPANTNLSSLAATIGPEGQGAVNQVTSALTGSIPAVASLTTGSSSSINATISGLTSSLPIAANPVSDAITSLTGQSSQLGTIANTAIKTITGALTNTPTNGINVADFAKQGPSLGPIQSLSSSDVTGTLAQASKLVGQTFSQLSNTLGVGKFGLDTAQLERAGYIKPGTAAAFATNSQADLSQILNSPLPWTGKNGVNGISDFLSNESLQNNVQQTLMSSGLGDLKQLGVPTDQFKPQALAGLATNAAKSVEQALAWVKNSASLPPSIKSKFDTVATNSAFAVKLTEGKVEPELKQEEPAPAETNTVNADTVNAAAKRIVGNEKVPSVSP